MTNKRRIPINGQGAAADSAAAPPSSGPGATAGRDTPRPAGADPVSAPAAPGTVAEPGSTTPRETAAAATPAAEQVSLAEGDRLEGEVESLRHERDVLAERELRLRAEFENFRRRASREATELRERAQGQLLTDLLPVLDNLERALDAAEHHDESKVLGGVRMTRDMFVELLRRAGVQEIESVGVPFDPNVHEAVVMQASDQEEGTVTAVLERGYRQGDRVLRPARVAVSAGAPEAAGK